MRRVIKREENPMNITNEHVEQLKSFLRGETTWAEIEGMTFEEARAIAQVGCDLAATGRLEEARIIFEGLVAGNPKDSGAQAALGTVYQKLGRNDDAVSAYDASLKADARNPVALANRGELRLKAGDKNGFADLARAVEADPHGETSASRRAKALIKAIAIQAVEHVRSQEKARVQK
jgi:Flp pilus assembly protein TadD